MVLENEVIDAKGFTAGWLSLENSQQNNGIIETYSVEEFKQIGFKLKNVLKTNSNGNPYLLAISPDNKISALYLSTGLKANLLGVTVPELKSKIDSGSVDYSALNGKVVKAEEINLTVVDTDNGEALIVSRVGTASTEWF